ncbi:MAG: hypothetical protein Q4C47_01030 [Planctomycetia bacterium]|nr:hypothetical protein [Planctomycetia bacterium]
MATNTPETDAPRGRDRRRDDVEAVATWVRYDDGAAVGITAEFLRATTRDRTFCRCGSPGLFTLLPLNRPAGLNL